MEPLFLHSSELMAHVDRVRESWLDSLALAGQRRSSTKEQLGYWRVYQRGSTLLSRLLREGDPLLSSAGPAVFAAHQLPSCTDDDQVSGGCTVSGSQRQATVEL